MSRTTFNEWFGKLLHRQAKSSKRTKSSRNLKFESLDERLALSVSASFSAGAHVLTVFGDAQANNIVVSRDASGRILINGGAVAVRGGVPTVANTSLVQ